MWKEYTFCWLPEKTVTGTQSNYELVKASSKKRLLDRMTFADPAFDKYGTIV